MPATVKFERDGSRSLIFGVRLFSNGTSPMLAAQYYSGHIIRRVLAAALLAVLLISTQDQQALAQQHMRPYFMPPAEREVLRDLILKQPWAKADYERLKKAASTGDGFAAAFLYALDGESRDAAIAQKWLLWKYGKKAFWTVAAA